MSTIRRWPRRTAVAIVGAFALLASLATPATASQSTDLSGATVFAEDITMAPDGTFVHTPANAQAVPSPVPADAAPKSDRAPESTVRVSPRLAARVATAAAADRLSDRISIIVTYVEDQQIPVFPSMDQSQAFAAPVNVSARAVADGLVRDLAARREPGYRTARAQIERLGGTVLDTYWLIRGVHATVPLSAVSQLAAQPDVSYVEPTDGSPPPSGNTEADARALLGTDPYFGTPPRVGDRVAIIDSGVKASHPLLAGRIDVHEDVTGENDALTDNCDHGTQTAAAISGGLSSGNSYRGITTTIIDVYKIYPNFGKSPCIGDSNLAVAGLQKALNNLEKVIVFEAQAVETEDSGQSHLSDNAFETGAVIISAAGNTGPDAKTVTAPGNARKVLGIGAVDVVDFLRYDHQSEGPTGDNRIKPDLVAPTNVETGGSGPTGFSIFSGTSGATAQAGGTAATLRQFVRGNADTVDPGFVYAGMIAGGSRSNGDFTDIEGAGKLRLSPPTGVYKRFSFTGSAGTKTGVGIKFNLAATDCRISAAAWWPENPGFHNDIDIKIIDPNGVQRAISQTGRSVFELARADGPLMTGQWTVLMYPYTTLKNNQRMYGTITTCR
jgi:hypothetical protein